MARDERTLVVANNAALPTPLQRREFLKVAAASIAFGNLAGCDRPPPEQIVPHLRGQDGFIPGVSQWFATSLTRQGHAMGVLARSDDARPTKIEGNPDHPASLSAADAITQAELLTLYDPVRSSAVRRTGRVDSWESFEHALRHRLASLPDQDGEGIWIVLGPQTSPTLEHALSGLLEEYPAASIVVHDPLRTGTGLEGARLATGTTAAQVLALDRCETIVALDADLFGPSPSGVRYAADFAARRRQSLSRGNLIPTLFVAQPSPTCTGARADHHLPAQRSRIAALARAIAHQLGVIDEQVSVPEQHRAWIEMAAASLRRAGPNGLMVAGETQPAEVHALALAVNASSGALGVTIDLVEPFGVAQERNVQPLSSCIDALESGAVGMLLIADANPAYDALDAPRLADAIRKAPFAAHMGLYRNETSACCRWHLPMAHDLERWGDARAFDGTAGLIQPLIRPMRNGRTPLWLLGAMRKSPRGSSDADTVMRYWKDRIEGDAWDAWRSQALRSGVIPGTRAPSLHPAQVQPPPRADSTSPRQSLEVAINPDPVLLAGEHAENAWLQELPDPVTQVAWGNAALLSPSTARTLGVKDRERVRVDANGTSLGLPARIIPGVADGVIALTLGYGRRTDNPVARRRGVDVSPLLHRSSPWNFPCQAHATGIHADAVLAQLHDTMEDREIVRVVRPGEPASVKRDIHLPQYQGPALTAPQQWGMSIDLGVCTGCSACVVACQAENNIPVVGPREVERGRRMHWIRVDRYFHDGDILMQPVACVHCENAPCELVCPTGATQHSSDGLNEMNYARCIGTRYCSNNCPYKVRRFNFFRYADDAPSLQKMRNPRVTTRGLGVMEKCTYCVQRIRQAEMDSRAKDSLIADSALRTACQQTCPTNAIVFGDVADADTRVSHAKRDKRTYSLLGHLNTKPRTTYLADVRPSRGQNNA